MYPIAYEVDFAEQRSRLSTFFRLLLAIPWIVVGIFWTIAGAVCALLAWFAILFTGRYPQGLYDVCAQTLRYTARVNAFALLLTDRYPPFDGGEHPEYPVRLPIAPPLPSYSRWKAGLRFILAIPLFVVLYLIQLLVRAIGVLAWLVIVVIGKEPRGIFDVLRFGLAYEARANGYLLLVTETYPPFSADDAVPATVAPLVS